MTHFWALGALAGLVGLFAVRQNVFHALGGPISMAKVLYLYFALAAFFLMPFFLWRNAFLPPPWRALWGWLFLSFALRAAAEAYLMSGAALGWKCVYGIGHDLATLLLAFALRLSLPADASAGAALGQGFLALYQAALVVEMFMAWRFSLVADPSKGIYYAAPTERFRGINRATWAANVWLYGWAGVLLWAWRGSFAFR